MNSSSKLILAIVVTAILAGCSSQTHREAGMSSQFKQDAFDTDAGKLTVTFVGHGTLMFEHDDTIVHVDPVGREADYSKMPAGDIILITHAHGDHLDPDALADASDDQTVIIVSRVAAGKVDSAHVMANGDTRMVKDIRIEAVPAYNLVHKRPSGEPFHPRGEGNGYVITFGHTRVFVAGDTENVPEIKALENIDIAFLPMNLPYTMTPEMVAETARAIQPKILYPYHYGQTDPQKLVQLLSDEKNIEVRIRPMQ